MDELEPLFAANRAWARDHVRRDPAFFENLVAIQRPHYLWIGCADSRVPANEIVALMPGELFVHRNVANLVAPGDPNARAVVQYAVDTLAVRHVIVCGHYRCGGVQAAMGPALDGPLEAWLATLRSVARRHRDTLDALADPDARWARLCELNVAAQVETLAGDAIVRGAWRRGQPLTLHGWIYDLADGLLRDLRVTRDA